MRIAVMDTNVFNTIIAAVKGAVSTSVAKPMYGHIRLEFRKENKAVTAIATDGFRLFVEHATCRHQYKRYEWSNGRTAYSCRLRHGKWNKLRIVQDIESCPHWERRKHGKDD